MFEIAGIVYHKCHVCIL